MVRLKSFFWNMNDKSLFPCMGSCVPTYLPEEFEYLLVKNTSNGCEINLQIMHHSYAEWLWVSGMVDICLILCFVCNCYLCDLYWNISIFKKLCFLILDKKFYCLQVGYTTTLFFFIFFVFCLFQVRVVHTFHHNQLPRELKARDVI